MTPLEDAAIAYVRARKHAYTLSATQAPYDEQHTATVTESNAWSVLCNTVDVAAQDEPVEEAAIAPHPAALDLSLFTAQLDNLGEAIRDYEYTANTANTTDEPVFDPALFALPPPSGKHLTVLSHTNEVISYIDHRIYARLFAWYDHLRAAAEDLNRLWVNGSTDDLHEAFAELQEALEPLPADLPRPTEDVQ